MLAISDETVFSRANPAEIFMCIPAVPLTVDSAIKGTPALPSAVTDAFQPVSSAAFSVLTLSLVVLLLSLLVMPTEYVNSCASVDVIPFQNPDALPVLFFSSLIDLTPPFL